MQLFKSAIIFTCFAALMLVAKPFVGFKALENLSQVKHPGICVKAFTKRKQEYIESGNFDASLAQKKLAEPLNLVLLHFAFLLSIILPIAFAAKNLSSSYLRRLQLSFSTAPPSYILTSALII